MKAVLIAAAFVGGATPQQFDLNCSGTTRTRTADTDTTKPFERHYRVDLKTRRWCADDCGAVHQIAEVQEAYLKLEPSSDESTPEGHKTFAIMINRTTGEETVLYSVFGRDFYSSESDAQCTRAAFSGFPDLPKRF